MGRASGFSFTLHCMRLARFCWQLGVMPRMMTMLVVRTPVSPAMAISILTFLLVCTPPVRVSRTCKTSFNVLARTCRQMPKACLQPEESQSGPLYGTSLLQVLARTVRGHLGPTTVPESRVQVRDSTALVATQQGLRSRLWPAFFCERRNLEVPSQFCNGEHLSE